MHALPSVIAWEVSRAQDIAGYHLVIDIARPCLHCSDIAGDHIAIDIARPCLHW
jgi:hypothetical protein